MRGSARLTLRHYVAGSAPNSSRAVANLKAICENYLPDRCSIETIDVFENPFSALDDNVYVCPTLLKLSPPPIGRIVGDLSDTETVLDALGIQDRRADEERN